MISSNLQSTTNRNERIFKGIVVTLIAIFTLMALALLINRYQSRMTLAEERVHGLTGIYEGNILLLMGNLESVMRATASQVKAGVEGEELHQYLESIASQLPQLRTLLVFDADGTVIGDSRPDESALGMSAVERYYYQVHLERIIDTVFIDNPVQSYVDGNWSMPITLAVRDENDELLGLVAVSIDPIYFSGALDTFEFVHSDMIQGYILNPERVILTTIPYNPELIGLSEADHTLETQIKDGLTSNVYEGIGLTSGETELISYQQIEPYDYIVVFTQAKQEILKAYAIEATSIVGIWLLISAISYLGFRYQFKQTQEIRKQANLRQQAELQAIQERNLLRTLIDNIPDYIFVKDVQKRFVETNIAHANGANLSRNDMLNRTAMDAFEANLAEQFHADDEQVLEEGIAIVNKERITTDSEGQKRWVLTTKVPLRDDKNNIVGLVGISRDITEHREAEVNRLEAERLRIEIEQEKEAIELKQRFITTASHDFRTPLTIIKSSATILERYHDRLTVENRFAKLAQIQNQVDHMTEIINDVLNLSKVSSGRIEPKYSNFDLLHFCERIWEDMEALDAGEHRHEFQYTASIKTIRSDEQLLQQALVNIVSNAFKYTPEGKLIDCLIDNDDEWVTFRIKDEGYGIPAAEQKQMFKPFQRASNVEGIDGTGLGLTIAKEYVELLKGSIEIVSEENLGTDVTIRIPIHD